MAALEVPDRTRVSTEEAQMHATIAYAWGDISREAHSFFPALRRAQGLRAKCIAPQATAESKERPIATWP